MRPKIGIWLPDALECWNRETDVSVYPVVAAGSSKLQKVAIQGEAGSNSHMAALQMLPALELVPCTLSADVFDRLLDGTADAAVLPIENSLHGSVAEHYDLLLQHSVRITAESLLRIRFHLIAMPGVAVGDLRHVLSHPVALAQCRRFLAQHRQIEAMPFYDTAGSVKHLMQAQLRDTAGLAPELAAIQYGAQILLRDLEDHAENFTRFHLLERVPGQADGTTGSVAAPGETPDAGLTPDPVPGQMPNSQTSNSQNQTPNKMSVAFSVDHRPGTLVAALQLLASAGVDLTRIESRPVPGRPWEYIFYAEFRFDALSRAETALAALRAHCRMVKELGRYRAA
jgi:prephenate dehydratase